ncbi:hypothetical protein CPT_Solomon_068 [Klebsiella phage Solomon]|uniref:Uncharacterized protein n=1 Tax=Klebsiella phage Solomon TaxID=2767583 RepID=A0A873WJ72_9CAUD|nr:hypothetical protein CPT_Solomon_068 [Klebsiella phage Solomon]
MKLRCTDSNSINYRAGFEYSAELGVTVRTPHGSIGCDVVHGSHTWFFFNKSTLTAERRNGSVVATFKVIE